MSGGASNSSGRQAYNAELIARIVGDSPYLLVPTVVRELVTEEVLVL